MNLKGQTKLPKPAPRQVTPELLAQEIVERLTYRIGKDAAAAKPHDWLHAVILAIRDRVIDAWIDSTHKTYEEQGRRVYYLSLEFLIGRLMRDAASNMEMLDDVQAALASLGVDIDIIAALEPDAALGNGGLGRLAACFMESMATVDVPAYGYGIRYVNGMFRQEISDGWQVELPENWLAHGNPWEFERREASYEVGFGGRVDPAEGEDAGPHQMQWKPNERVIATPYDTPIAGWRGKRVNTLRLWEAQPIDPILLDKFNAGDHLGALAESNRAEALTRVLYPADSSAAGQELRLRQEYFFSSASLQDIVRRHIQYFGAIQTLPDKAAIQLNDTHPAVAVAELMRVLLDDHGLDFDEAWDITRRTFSYTNHTLLPEALESWPVPLFERLLPRHMQIVYAVNSRLLAEARRLKSEDGARQFDDAAIGAISLIDEHGGRRVRMGNLAFAGSHSVNGVSALHTDLMKETVFADFHTLYPTRINNKTNGVTPRRWLQQVNPGLTTLAREAIGDRFLDDPEAISDLDAFADDGASWMALPTTAASRRNSSRSSAPTRSRSPTCCASASTRGSTRPPCSTSRSSVSTNISGNCSTSSKRCRSTTRSDRTRNGTGCRASSCSAARPRPAIIMPSSSSNWPMTSRARSIMIRRCRGCSRCNSCPIIMSPWPR